MHLMHVVLASRIMPRTTIDIDANVLRKLKSRQARDGKPLGQIVSELLAVALAEPESTAPPPFVWTVRDMGVLIDLEDKEAVRRALEGDL
jgi:hypothetical protein